MRLTSRLLILFAWLFSTAFTAIPSQNSDQAVVRALLFYSPACGHCHYVINEVLPPLLEKYGDQLQITGINVSTQEGSALFATAIAYYGMEGAGVPFLVVGDHVLIGSVDIPELFPGLIEMYLSQGGVNLPPIPGLMETAQTVLVLPTPTAQQIVDPASVDEPSPDVLPAESSMQLIETPTLNDRLNRDPIGNSFAIIVLLGMLISFGVAIARFNNHHVPINKQYSAWTIPILCVLGLAIAGYLAYVESTHTQAVCGPVGDCNTVQQSEYARLFGILPIGILGLIGFMMIMSADITYLRSSGKLSAYAGLTLLALTTFGALFSIYLTFLEPYVIGATCAWCLTSAIIMTILLQLSLSSGKQAVLFLRSGTRKRRSVRKH